MNVQVLVATMNQSNHLLLDKMNIQTDAIIGNQCDRNEIESFDYRNHSVKWLSFSERGVGLNRNNTLMRATGDIVLFADDDVVYDDGYEEKIIQYYIDHPKADVVIFNFQMKRDGKSYERVSKEGRVNRRAATKYGTYCISARTVKIRSANIFFHLDFGGGTKYSSGEDTIFLQDCLKNKLRVYSSKTIIGSVDHGPSTWFKGYNDKYYFDKGVLFYVMFPQLCNLCAIVHCYKYRKKYKEYGWIKAYKQMRKGMKVIKQDLQ